MYEYEPISPQRLEDFGAALKEYNSLKKQKEQIERRFGLAGVDYSKVKVTAGNNLRASEEERYVMALQKINDAITDYEKWLIPEKEIITRQIARVKSHDYRKILVLRYIEKYPWKEIIQECFWYEPDFEEERQGKYRDKVFYWHRQALKELEEISAKPYIPLQMPLTL